MLQHGSLALFVALGSIAFGMAGYMYYENLPWRDAFLNTAMLMGGMGPVDPPKTPGGKLFAGFYALFSGVAGPRAELLGPHSYVLLLLTSLIGLAATFYWWRNADQTC